MGPPHPARPSGGCDKSPPPPPPPRATALGHRRPLLLLLLLLALINWHVHGGQAAPTRPFVSHFASHGVRHYTFVGEHAGKAYQARVWLRVACGAGGSARDADDVRLVVSLTAPRVTLAVDGVHVTTPKTLLDADGTLPEVWFESDAGARIAARHTADPDVVRREWASSAWLALARLPRGGAEYTLRMEGSDAAFQLPSEQCSEAHQRFAGGAWTCVVEAGDRRAQTSLPFLITQHLRHHQRMGFAGMLLVVRRHTAKRLLDSADIRRAAARQSLRIFVWVSCVCARFPFTLHAAVVVVAACSTRRKPPPQTKQDYGLIDTGVPGEGDYYIQVPAVAVMRLVLWGSDARLGSWDLDEYYVSPSGTHVTCALAPGGCLHGNGRSGLGSGDRPHEAVLWNSWAAVEGDGAVGREVDEWMRHGSWEAAMQAMNYT
jgi:hypothetical protein